MARIQGKQLTNPIILSGSFSGSFQGAGSITSASFATQALTASFAISASHEIIKEVSSSHADTASFAGNLFGTPSIVVSNITASNISASGDIIGATFGDSAGNIVFTGNVSGSGTNSSYFGDEYNAHGNDANSGFTLLSFGTKPSILANGGALQIGNAFNTNTGINLIGNVTASNNISASGDIFGNNGSFTTSITTPEISGNTEITGDLQVVNITADGRISTTSHITASGNISANGDLSIQGFPSVSASLAAATGSTPTLQQVTDQGASTTTAITASIISASGNIFGSNITQTQIQFDVPIISGSHQHLYIGDVAENSNGLRFNINDNTGTVLLESLGSPGNAILQVEGNLTASGNISASGDVISHTGSFNHVSSSGEIFSSTLRVADTGLAGTNGGILISASTFDSDPRDAQIIYPNHGLHFNATNGENHVLALFSHGVGIRTEPTGFNNALLVSGSIQVLDGHITASGNISASGNVFGITGSFSHVEGNSPITVGDPVTFQQPITAEVIDTSFETFFNFEAASAFTYIAPFGLTVNFTGSSTGSMGVVGFVTASANTDTFSSQQTIPITLNQFDKLKITPAAIGLFTISGSRTI